MTDLWENLKNCSTPILLYGMGNGGDKILEVCRKKGIPISGVFASDGFVKKGKRFHGMPITDYATAVEKFGDFTVLLCFATTLDGVLANILKIATERPLCIPDVPVAGETLFDGAFYQEHRAQFKNARAVFADERSRAVFDCIIESKLTGKLQPLMQEISTADDDFNEILHPDRYKICADLGGYTGDTVKDLLRRCPNIQKIVSVEPDPKTFSKLEKNCIGLPVLPVHGAAWEKEEPLFFTVSGNRGSGIGAIGKKQTEVPGVTVDRLFEDCQADYLKYDVEGAELSALKGSEKIIRRDRPELLVSCYHRPEDLFLLPLYFKERYPFYRLYLRRHKGVPAWDINLYAVNGG